LQRNSAGNWRHDYLRRHSWSGAARLRDYRAGSVTLSIVLALELIVQLQLVAGTNTAPSARPG
jgi:hypothetical protein